jgi:hypothetical protein
MIRQWGIGIICCLVMVSVALPFQLMDLSGAFTQGSVSIGVGSEAHAMGWHPQGPGSSPGPRCTPTPVPEPITGSLVGLGLGILAAARGIKKR